MGGSRFAREHKPLPKSTARSRNTAPETTDIFRDAEKNRGMDTPEHILSMQATYGNQAVLRYLAQRVPAIQRQKEPGPDAGVGGPPNNAAPPAPRLSGKAWYNDFPTSVSTDDLTEPFKANAIRFLKALTDAGASYTISATFRPIQRAYLMHYAWAIARDGMNPASVPAYDGDGDKVNIDWVHRDAQGKVDRAASKAAAEEMVVAYDMAHNAALPTRHTEGHAMDVNISWDGDLSIKDASGHTVVIKTEPRTGSGNEKLHAVGATYGVIKLLSDPPHWSTDGK
ncbi:MAG: hypothetical protein ACYDBJ_27415 [Aggregatilineales bacterium]